MMHERRFRSGLTKIGSERGSGTRDGRYARRGLERGRRGGGHGGDGWGVLFGEREGRAYNASRSYGFGRHSGVRNKLLQFINLRNNNKGRRRRRGQGRWRSGRRVRRGRRCDSSRGRERRGGRRDVR
jgi:hypothetical protein